MTVICAKARNHRIAGGGDGCRCTIAIVRAYVGVTDNSWYRFLADRPAIAEVNFWQPSLNDSRVGRGWLLIVLCRFSAVVTGWRVPGGWRCWPDVLGTAPVPTAPERAPFRVAETGWLVRRVLAGRIAAASRSRRRLSRARSG